MTINRHFAFTIQGVQVLFQSFADELESGLGSLANKS